MTRRCPVRSLLLLLLLVGAVGAVSWLLLAPGADDTDEGGGAESWSPEPVEDDAGASRVPPGPAAPIELPVVVHPRVAVLAEGESLPPRGSESAPQALHELQFEPGEGPITGEDLIRSVGKAIYLRARSSADLQALEAVDPDPAWAEAPVPLTEVLELWRREGFEVVEAGHVLIVTRRRE